MFRSPLESVERANPPGATRSFLSQELGKSPSERRCAHEHAGECPARANESRRCELCAAAGRRSSQPGAALCANGGYPAATADRPRNPRPFHKPVCLPRAESFVATYAKRTTETDGSPLAYSAGPKESGLQGLCVHTLSTVPIIPVKRSPAEALNSGGHSETQYLSHIREESQSVPVPGRPQCIPA